MYVCMYLTYINGYDDPAIISGAGAMGVEIMGQLLGVECGCAHPNRRCWVTRWDCVGYQDTLPGMQGGRRWAGCM